MTPNYLDGFGRRFPNWGSFIRKASVKATSTAETPLPEHNEPQEPGSATSPKGPHSSIVSAAGLLDLAHPASGGFAPADVFGRRFESSSKRTMPEHATSTSGGQRCQIAPAIINNLGGPTPPLVHATPPWSTKPAEGSGQNGVDQADQGNYVSGNKERGLSDIEICSRDEGYVYTLVQLVHRISPAAVSGFAGPPHPGPVQGGCWSTPGLSRECGRNAPTLVHTPVQPEVGA